MIVCELLFAVHRVKILYKKMVAIFFSGGILAPELKKESNCRHMSKTDILLLTNISLVRGLLDEEKNCIYKTFY